MSLVTPLCATNKNNFAIHYRAAARSSRVQRAECSVYGDRDENKNARNRSFVSGDRRSLSSFAAAKPITRRDSTYKSARAFPSYQHCKLIMRRGERRGGTLATEPEEKKKKKEKHLCDPTDPVWLLTFSAWTRFERMVVHHRCIVRSSRRISLVQFLAESFEKYGISRKLGYWQCSMGYASFYISI